MIASVPWIPLQQPPWTLRYTPLISAKSTSPSRTPQLTRWQPMATTSQCWTKQISTAQRPICRCMPRKSNQRIPVNIWEYLSGRRRMSRRLSTSWLMSWSHDWLWLFCPVCRHMFCSCVFAMRTWSTMMIEFARSWTHPFSRRSGW